MPSPPPTEAILFDLDGTLLNSLQDLAHAMNRILSEDDLPTHGLDDYRYFIGGGARYLVDAALPAEKRAETELYLTRFRRYYRDNLVRKTAPYPGIGALLETLDAQKMPMAILSNKPDDMTQVLVARFFADIPWRAISGAHDGQPKKPDPIAVAPLLAALGVPAERVLMVGDTKTDMMTAKNSAMRGIGVTWGFRERAELEAHGADAVIETPEALLALL